MPPILISLFGVKLDNPATPWVVLTVVTALWLALYFRISAGPRA